MLSLKPFNRPSICRRLDSHTCFIISLFLYLEMSLFPRDFFGTISSFSLYRRVRHRTFYPSKLCFSTLRPRAGFFTSAYVRIQSIRTKHHGSTLNGRKQQLVASEYPSMTNMEIIQYTNVLFTQAPIRVCPHGTNIDSRTTLVTMYYCG